MLGRSGEGFLAIIIIIVKVGKNMNFTELIETARREKCTDVHVTVGTAIARRRYGELEILDPVPTAEESKQIILEKLTEEQREKVLKGEDLDFATALYSALREDPDVILVGEMRDYETIRAAITAAETGHLVLSTLHTCSAAQTIERIIEAYPPHAQNQISTQLSSVLNGVITQVLVPLLDGEGLEIATEVMINNEAIANQIRGHKIHQIPSTIQSSSSVGMHTLDNDLKRMMGVGKISKKTALKYCLNPKVFAV